MTMSRLHSCLPLAVAGLLGLGACAPGDESAPAQVTPFQFNTSDDVTLDAQVLLDG
ncbi:MAG: hypothetical protein ACYS26_10530 [Planctomycetota bacterium]|jgi:hypothetical protein